MLHSGIYYNPGSLRATNCREGRLAIRVFCEKENISFARWGKVIVAVTREELSQLERIYERGRGGYFELKSSLRHLCRGLIYPVSDSDFPFLGVHFTKMIHGGVKCGPNAILAFSREGYDKTSFSLFDTLESLTYPGFLRLAGKHWRAGTSEMWRSLSEPAFVAALRRLVPELRICNAPQRRRYGRPERRAPLASEAR